MEDPEQELVSFGRGLGFKRRDNGTSEGPTADIHRIMHAVETTRQVTELSIEFQALSDYQNARQLVDLPLATDRSQALRQASTAMKIILNHKSRLVERLRAAKMSETIPIEQQHQGELQVLLDACVIDLHDADEASDAVQWATTFHEPTSVWEDRTRMVVDAAQALETLDKEERARGALMDQLVRSVR